MLVARVARAQFLSPFLHLLPAFRHPLSLRPPVRPRSARASGPLSRLLGGLGRSRSALSPWRASPPGARQNFNGFTGAARPTPQALYVGGGASRRGDRSPFR